MAILFQKSAAFGLDISELCFRFAKLEKTNQALNLTCFGEKGLAKGIIEQGEVKDVTALAQALNQGLSGKRRDLKTNQVALGLPEEKSFFDVIKIPKVTDEELPSAVRFEAQNYIPVSLEDVYFDFEKSWVTAEHQNVLVAAIPKKIVDPYLEALNKAKLQPRYLEIESSAIARALIKKDKPQPPLLLIDFGGTRTGLIIFAGKHLRFTSTLPFASQDLTKVLAKHLQKDLSEAEKLKIEQGLTGRRDVREAAIPFLTDLMEQIKKYIEYYHSHARETEAFHNGRDLTKILLCGGGSLLQGLPQFLSEEIGIDVELGNPWVNILDKPSSSSFPRPKSPLSYTTALGLALRGLEHD